MKGIVAGKLSTDQRVDRSSIKKNIRDQALDISIDETDTRVVA